MLNAKCRMARTTLTVIALALAVALTHAESPPASTLRSFYVATPAGFGLWTWEIISVEPAGHDVRVRVMRVQSVSETCPQVLVVQAAERLVRQSTVQAVGRVRICDMSQGVIDRALARARTPRVGYVDYLGSTQRVVADCGGRQRVLDLVDSARSGWVNLETLRRKASVVSALWDFGAAALRRHAPRQLLQALAAGRGPWHLTAS
jgi:hypothetical protein